jgi:hypothetical protein
VSSPTLQRRCVARPRRSSFIFATKIGICVAVSAFGCSRVYVRGAGKYSTGFAGSRASS